MRVRKAPDENSVGEDIIIEAKDSKRKGTNAATIRPHLAILTRLLIAHPEYIDLLPPKPSNRTVYNELSRLVKRFNNKDDWRGEFAQLFGRSKISSYKMLPKDFDEMATDRRENSQPVIRLQMLIMERFGKIFRDTYQAFCYSDMPERLRSEGKHRLQYRNWLALKEWEAVTIWMPEEVRERFDEAVKEKCDRWFENVYMATLENEAISRNLTLAAALKDGKWTNNDSESEDDWSRYPLGAEPILGGQSGIFEQFRETVKISSPEMLWLLGLQIKSYFRHRERPDRRIDPSVSILVRHFYNNLDDLELFITHPPTGNEILKRIQAIDPSFERRQIGLLFGGGVVAGYNMTQPGASMPFFAYRLASIFARHIEDGPEIYWHLREAVEEEVRARGLDLDTFWKEGHWYKENDGPS